MITSDSADFPPVWIINRSSSKERREAICQNLSELFIPFEVVEGIDGDSLTKIQLEAYSPIRSLLCNGRSLSGREIGCALSHYGCWERMLSENRPEALILEDDVVLTEDFRRLLMIRDKLPDDWEKINFISDTDGPPCGDALLGKYRPIKFHGFDNRAACYLLRAKGAEKLLAHAYPITRALDGLTGRAYLSGLITYGLTPSPVSLRNVPSDIWAKGHEPTKRSPISRLISFVNAHTDYYQIWKLRRRI